MEKTFNAYMAQRYINDKDIVDILYEYSLNSWFDIFFFLDDENKLTKKAFNVGLKTAWVSSSTDNNRRVINSFMRTDKKLIMNEKELEYYNNLPDVITVYRGCDKGEVDDSDSMLGISWTMEEKVAEFFAYRYYQAGTAVYSMTIPKKDIKGIFLDMNECEAIYLGADKNKVTMVSDSKTFLYDEYIEEKRKRNE